MKIFILYTRRQLGYWSRLSNAISKPAVYQDTQIGGSCLALLTKLSLAQNFLLIQTPPTL